MESASIAAGAKAHEHHGPPEANQSSRIDRQTFGIYLFIVSEIMLFGAFFASYFFLRVVANPGEAPWPPEGFELPVAIAGVNTAILVSSSFTVHWALESIKRGNHRGLKLGLIEQVEGITDKSIEHIEAGEGHATVVESVPEHEGSHL